MMPASMPPAVRRYVVLEQGVGAAVVNLLINGVIAWAMFRGAATVPMWGEQSIGGDTIGTTFFLPFLTSLIATRIVWAQMRSGRVPALAEIPPALPRLPRSPAARGAVLGVLGVAVVGVPAAFALSFAGITEMRFWSFVGFKATFAALLGLVVTPVIALYALASPRPRER
jgi:hypothetical protein